MMMLQLIARLQKALLKNIKEWQMANSGRMVTYQVSGFKFEPQEGQDGQFYYQEQSSANYFTVSESSSAFIPRHYLQMYYLRIVEFLELRNEAINLINCEDIFFYSFVQHLYPQLPAVYLPVQKGFTSAITKQGQSKSKTKYSFYIRRKCITDISRYFGYNPLRYYSKIQSQISKNWKMRNQTLSKVLQQKIQGLSEIETQIIMQKNVEEYLANREKAFKQQKKFEQSRKQQEQRNNMLQNQQEKEYPRDKKSKQQGTIERQIKQVSTQLSFQSQAAILILIITILSFTIVQLYQNNCNKKSKNRIRINEDEQNQFSTIRLPEMY